MRCAKVKGWAPAYRLNRAARPLHGPGAVAGAAVAPPPLPWRWQLDLLQWKRLAIERVAQRSVLVLGRAWHRPVLGARWPSHKAWVGKEDPLGVAMDIQGFKVVYTLQHRRKSQPLKSR